MARARQNFARHTLQPHGQKLRKTVSPTVAAGYARDYVNGLEYRINSGGGTFEYPGWCEVCAARERL